ncbi:hypothetical protein EYF80_021725 [Liparis tanakae]|uniref:Uncharacterized protein n=1 Tax=Liparis tanakae TaxID=230148 RepID=A0A4Z2HR19_9TELE|nr:hypothetical protein EYF80_021725 [Liparis tanakae]
MEAAPRHPENTSRWDHSDMYLFENFPGGGTGVDRGTLPAANGNARGVKYGAPALGGDPVLQ